MRRRSSRIYFQGKDHAEIFIGGKYHDKAIAYDKDLNRIVLWEKIGTQEIEMGLSGYDAPTAIGAGNTVYYEYYNSSTKIRTVKFWSKTRKTFITIISKANIYILGYSKNTVCYYESGTGGNSYRVDFNDNGYTETTKLPDMYIHYYDYKTGEKGKEEKLTGGLKYIYDENNRLYLATTYEGTGYGQELYEKDGYIFSYFSVPRDENYSAIALNMTNESNYYFARKVEYNTKSYSNVLNNLIIKKYDGTTIYQNHADVTDGTNGWAQLLSDFNNVFYVNNLVDVLFIDITRGIQEKVKLITEDGTVYNCGKKYNFYFSNGVVFDSVNNNFITHAYYRKGTKQIHSIFYSKNGYEFNEQFVIKNTVNGSLAYLEGYGLVIGKYGLPQRLL